MEHEGCVSSGCPHDRHPRLAARHAAIVGRCDAVSSEGKSLPRRNLSGSG